MCADASEDPLLAAAYQSDESAGLPASFGDCKALRKPLTSWVRPRFSNKVLLGQGSYNSVFVANMDHPCKIENIIVRESSDAVDPEEIATALRMDFWGIGPRVYYHTHELIVMEKFDTDLFRFLERYPTCVDSVMPKVLSIIRKLTNRRYFCSDLKAGNIVLNHTEGRVGRVRLIDFDRRFLTRIPLPSPVYPRRVFQFVLKMWMLLLMACHLNYQEMYSQSINEEMDLMWEAGEYPDDLTLTSLVTWGKNLGAVGMLEAYFEIDTSNAAAEPKKFLRELLNRHLLGKHLLRNFSASLREFGAR